MVLMTYRDLIYYISGKRNASTIQVPIAYTKWLLILLYMARSVQLLIFDWTPMQQKSLYAC